MAVSLQGQAVHVYVCVGIMFESFYLVFGCHCSGIYIGNGSLMIMVEVVNICRWPCMCVYCVKSMNLILCNKFSCRCVGSMTKMEV